MTSPATASALLPPVLILTCGFPESKMRMEMFKSTVQYRLMRTGTLKFTRRWVCRGDRVMIRSPLLLSGCRRFFSNGNNPSAAPDTPKSDQPYVYGF